MSLVSISGGATGTGTFTVLAPSTNTNRTLTLPDSTTTVVGTDATQTLTNKTLTSPTLTTPNIDSAQIATVSGTAPIYMCRAWVNFNGTANSNLSGTYSQSGTTVTVTATAHGYIVGSSINADITSGTGVDGIYTVTAVTDANTFTYTAGTSLTTSGNITLLRNTINANGNVSSITDNGTGDYTVNFTTAMPDANYCTVTMASPAASSDINNFLTTRDVTYLPTTTSVRLANKRDSGILSDSPQCNVAIFR